MVHILSADLSRRSWWRSLASTIAREHGLLDIPTDYVEGSPWQRNPRDYRGDCFRYVLEAEADLALDLMEIALRHLESELSTNTLYARLPIRAGDPTRELNHRFQEHGVGYRYESGKVIRADSEVVHESATRPAFALLRAPGFEGPNQEFMLAHEHYRHRRMEDANTNACKAFESTMKAICNARGWVYDKNGTANVLIKTIIEKGLVPAFSEEQLQNVHKCLLGLATVRSKMGAHGAGAEIRDVPEHCAAYALNLAASNIVFLVKSHQALK